MQELELRDINLYVHEQGEGTPLVFLHAFPLDHRVWRHQIDEFSEGCRVIAPDLPGFGRSRSPRPTLSMRQCAEDLHRMLDMLEVLEPVILCGLSMGGYVAWQFCQKYPLRVAALIACDTRAVADTPEARAARLDMAAKVTSAGATVAADAMLPKFFAPKTYEERPELVEEVRQVILATDPAAIAAAQRGMAERPDMTSHLSEFDIPTLLVAGEHDTISTPKEMRQIAERMPNARCSTIRDAGHLSPLENPRAFNDAVSHFLT